MSWSWVFPCSTLDSPATNCTTSLKAVTSVWTFSTIASASSSTVMTDVPAALRLTVTPFSTSAKVFDPRSKVPLKPPTVKSAFCPACVVCTASVLSSWTTVIVLDAPVSRLTRLSR